MQCLRCGKQFKPARLGQMICLECEAAERQWKLEAEAMVERLMTEQELSFGEATKRVLDELRTEAFQKETADNRFTEMVHQGSHLIERLYLKEPEACAKFYPTHYEEREYERLKLNQPEES